MMRLASLFAGTVVVLAAYLALGQEHRDLPAVNAPALAGCLHETPRPSTSVTNAIKREMCRADPSGAAYCVSANELDHIVPLCLCGDPVAPNLQLQPWPDALAKDEAERGACRWYWAGPPTPDRWRQALGVVRDWRNW
jgi:hypothetical protein